MTPQALAAALALVLSAAAPRPAPTRTPPPAAADGEETVEDAVRFEAPAAEMRKLDVVLGAWTFEETWSRPERYKRGLYEGRPGPGGRGTLTFRRGPGSFSVVGEDDAHNPMGRVTALVVVAWDPERHAYDYEEIHGAFPGVLHLTGRFEGSDLVFRGEDARTGKRRAVRAVWKELGQDRWTITWSEGERGRLEPVMTRTLDRAGASAPPPSPSPSPSPSSPRP
jgi:hypothetical protein